MGLFWVCFYVKSLILIRLVALFALLSRFLLRWPSDQRLVLKDVPALERFWRPPANPCLLYTLGGRSSAPYRVRLPLLYSSIAYGACQGKSDVSTVGPVCHRKRHKSAPLAYRTPPWDRPRASSALPQAASILCLSVLHTATEFLPNGLRSFSSLGTFPQ